MKNISIRLTDSQVREVSRLARKQKVTQSEVVREAIEEYVTRGQSGNDLNCLQLVDDLAGSLDAPADLSHNPDHMKGYGQ